jgi:hypothetical protein
MLQRFSEFDWTCCFFGNKLPIESKGFEARGGKPQKRSLG